METKRARRRRDLKRMKAKAVRIFGPFGGNPKRHEKLANHLAFCNRFCCRNPRRYGEQTKQERVFRAEEIDGGEGS